MSSIATQIHPSDLHSSKSLKMEVVKNRYGSLVLLFLHAVRGPYHPGFAGLSLVQFIMTPIVLPTNGYRGIGRRHTSLGLVRPVTNQSHPLPLYSSSWS